ncbi:LysM peptidoglycan-binding domain-containing protein [Thalassobacillus pellis]|uniref:LysM peptidoglycan-binding domain-containing protein n=1 Tax=Thalassobacillus pellis TaxID=748008 RepID=UPI001EF8301F|nr:LysM peptidoglycan-binding domain-containing protein [Thalassobacillus pellis]MBM7554369.1 LysM repeat protein [Thalassobacillus pellis]
MNNNLIKKAIVTTSFVGALTFGASVADAESVTVERGDTLWGFSQQYGVSIYTIKSLNGLSSDIIYPGQVLKVNEEASSNTSSNSSNTSSATSTYTVQSGDTLSEIGAKFGVNYRDIQEWNNISGHLIYVGQVLKLNGVSEADTSAPAVSDSNDSASASTYTVQSGDTLSKIGAQYGVNYRDIMRWNNLNSTVIYVGQKLSINGSSSAPTQTSNNGSSETSSDLSGIVSTAKSYIGVPYKWGGESPSGFDCSGFLQYIFAKHGVSIPRTVATIWNAGTSVSQPSVGDIVFYETYKAGPSHAGVYIGNGQFIHSGSDGVTIANMNGNYWTSRYLGAKTY